MKADFFIFTMKRLALKAVSFVLKADFLVFKADFFVLTTAPPVPWTDFALFGWIGPDHRSLRTRSTPGPGMPDHTNLGLYTSLTLTEDMQDALHDGPIRESPGPADEVARRGAAELAPPVA